MPNTRNLLDHGIQAQTPGTSAFASAAISDLFPTPNKLLSQLGIPIVSDAADFADQLHSQLQPDSSFNPLSLALALAPFVSSTAIRDIPASLTYRGKSSFNPDPKPATIYENPNRSEMAKVLNDQRRDPSVRHDPEIRYLRDDKDNVQAWSADEALHRDVFDYLNIPSRGPGSPTIYDSGSTNKAFGVDTDEISDIFSTTLFGVKEFFE